MLYPEQVTIADHQIGPTLRDWIHQRGDGAPGVLVVCIGVDDDIGAVGTSHAHRSVDRSAVEDKPLDRIEARHSTWQVGESGGELIFLVQARHLNDELPGDAVHEDTFSLP